MKKKLGRKVKNQEEAERVMVRFLKDLMGQRQKVVIRERPRDWLECLFRGKSVAVNDNCMIYIGKFELPRSVCAVVGNELRAWMFARVKEQRARAHFAAVAAYDRKVCAFAEELLAAK